MSITPERRTALIAEYATAEHDTGSPEVQVAPDVRADFQPHRPFEDPRQGFPFPGGAC